MENKVKHMQQRLHSHIQNIQLIKALDHLQVSKYLVCQSNPSLRPPCITANHTAEWFQVTEGTLTLSCWLSNPWVTAADVCAHR